MVIPARMLFGTMLLVSAGLVARAPALYSSPKTAMPRFACMHGPIGQPAAAAAAPALHRASLCRSPPAVSRSPAAVMRTERDESNPVKQALAGLTVAFSLLSKAIA